VPYRSHEIQLIRTESFNTHAIYHSSSLDECTAVIYRRQDGQEWAWPREFMDLEFERGMSKPQTAIASLS